MDKKKTAFDVVKAFCRAWKLGDHKAMLDSSTLTYRGYHKIKDIEVAFGSKTLIRFKVKEKETIVPAMVDIDVEIHYKQGTAKYNRITKVRCVCERQAFDASVNGSWGVNPISALRERDLPPKPKTKESKK